MENRYLCRAHILNNPEVHFNRKVCRKNEMKIIQTSPSLLSADRHGMKSCHRSSTFVLIYPLWQLNGNFSGRAKTIQ